ncbi:flagellar protein FliS [Acidocella sp.]|uniref:flagellar protein FliS n=1 Tax=Acidocella sp. TaxID=50710 RepID=UPI0026233454|nr:flagellar protein FliS [Acidocella sp.]
MSGMDDITLTYRAAMFDGEPGLHWLRPGWRALRQYGQRARLAIEANDPATKALMISRADELLTLLSGIIADDKGAALGSALGTVYAALRFTLLRANAENSVEALRDYDAALTLLCRETGASPEHEISAKMVAA